MRNEIAQSMFGKNYENLTTIQKKAVNTKMVRKSKSDTAPNKSNKKSFLAQVLGNFIKREFNR